MPSFAKLAHVAGRLLAALCLYIGLALAARLLGVNTGSHSPLAAFGVTAFTYLGIFTLGYLFAAVGIWIGSAWGYVVTIGTALVELVLIVSGDTALGLSNLDFVLALVVLIVAAGLFVVIEIKPFSSLHD